MTFFDKNQSCFSDVIGLRDSLLAFLTERIASKQKCYCNLQAKDQLQNITEKWYQIRGAMRKFWISIFLRKIMTAIWLVFTTVLFSAFKIWKKNLFQSPFLQKPYSGEILIIKLLWSHIWPIIRIRDHKNSGIKNPSTVTVLYR